MTRFTETQQKALDMARNGVLTSAVADKVSTDVFGDPVPGIATFRKLIKEGFIFETEEYPITLESGEQFYFTDEGEALFAPAPNDLSV